jgi:PIN domain nuclease of toxin-antitoxin system
MLVAKGRLALTMDIDDWLATVESIEGVSFVPVEPDVAVQSVRLPGEFHPDPADRMIVALARHHSAALVTADAKIQAYQHVKTVW